MTKLIVFFGLMINLAWALEGRLLPADGNSITIKPGEGLEAVLEVWPKGEVNFDDVYELKGEDISGLFYVTDILKTQESANNPDVAEIFMHIVLIRNFKDTNLHIMELNKQNVPFTIEKIKPLAGDAKGDQLYVMEQDVISDEDYTMYTLYGLGIIVVLILVMKLFSESRKKIKNAVDKSKDKKKWKKIFAEAQKREDFEFIYTNKDEWLEGIPKTQPIVDFFTILNKHQYRPQWNDDSLQEVKEYFEPIRGIF